MSTTTFKKLGRTVLIEKDETSYILPVSCFIRPDPRNNEYIVISDVANAQKEYEGLRIKVSEIADLQAQTTEEAVKELILKYFIDIGYDNEVALGLINGVDPLYKFGRNASVNDEAIIWDGGNGYIIQDTQQTIQVFSDSSDDNATGIGARELHIFGLDGDFKEIDEKITLLGTSIATTTQLFRFIYRARVSKAGSSKENQGNLTMQTASGDLAALIIEKYGQTQMCIYPVPVGKKALVNDINLWSGRGRAVLAKLKVIDLGRTDGAWQVKAIADCYENDIPETFKCPRVVNEKHLIVITAENIDNGAIEVSAKFEFKLFDNSYFI